ncbi:MULTISPECIES: hypothetical protein [Brevibacillus]|uniref:hypothetical protein n=1 Tax=Brevibacillus TaxID=55080 RepID=UPI000D0F5BF5|nr:MULTISPECIES: hypothetical protein [Brevibacillus]MED1944724.1 hypothetical protein [Brevibacillus formosus]MED1996589.1 hypothetical protein [Brevibacillus formosus]MED2081558.1 hypothetical protein [Brevibacillus formosus]PSK19958.1 hypothetical protein C7R94_07535 [Brevibacillus sp. NRRL NRS-603]
MAPTGGTQETNQLEILTGANKDGRIKVVFDDGQTRKDIIQTVNMNDNTTTVFYKLMDAIYQELGFDYDMTGSGMTIYIKEPTQEADKDITITLEDLDATGVTGAGSEWRKGAAGTDGVAEVNELEITEASGSKDLSVNFTDGNYLNETVTVTLQGTETPSEITDKIASAFQALNNGKGLFRQTITVSGAKVTFTSTKTVADQNITITVTSK